MIACPSQLVVRSTLETTGATGAAEAISYLDTHLTRIQHWAVSAFGGDAVAPAVDIDPIVVHGEWSNRLPADLVAVFTRLGAPQLIHLPGHDLLTAERAREIWIMWLAIIADQRARIPEYAAEYDPVVFSADPRQARLYGGAGDQRAYDVPVVVADMSCHDPEVFRAAVRA